MSNSVECTPTTQTPKNQKKKTHPKPPQKKKKNKNNHPPPKKKRKPPHPPPKNPKTKNTHMGDIRRKDFREKG